MRVTLLVGSLPPQICGVGAFVARLGNELQDAGCEVSLISSPTWRLSEGPRLTKLVKRSRPDVVHFHYPSQAFGAAMLPNLIPLALHGAPFVITMHEFSALWSHARRKEVLMFRLRLMLSRARRIVVNDDLEGDRIARWLGEPRQKRIRFVPNATPLPPPCASSRDPRCVVFFGVLNAAAPLENFVTLMRLAEADRQFTFQVIGGLPPGPSPGARALVEDARDLGARIIIGADDQTASDALGEATYAYLPYPAGAHPKNTSLLAAIQAGLTVLTPHSANTPAALRAVTVNAASPEEALASLQRLSAEPDAYPVLRAATAPPLPYDWSQVVESTLEVYREVARVGASMAGAC